MVRNPWPSDRIGWTASLRPIPRPCGRRTPSRDTIPTRGGGASYVTSRRRDGRRRLDVQTLARLAVRTHHPRRGAGHLHPAVTLDDHPTGLLEAAKPR
ncbi:hypothetical protein NL676_019633 [Syzygium grande]|nr:hypothetical protein NL676_019633 [Syzygium grande]